MDRTRQAEPRTASSFVISGDARLAVFEHGDPSSETVLLVHGWPDTHAVWDGVVSLLAASFHVVTYDTRGHGASPLPGSSEQFTLDLLADDVVAVARAVSPDLPVHPVAHDWGSIQLWEAVCRPDAAQWFASFTSISGPSLDHATLWLRGLAKRPTPRNLATLAHRAAKSSYIYFFLTPGLPEALLPVVGRRVWPRLFKATEGIDAPEPAATLTDDMVAGVRLYRANMVQRLLHPKPRRSAVPVQLVVSSGDIAMKPSMFADAADWSVDLTRIDPDRGHWLPVSDPQLVADPVTTYVHARGGKDA
ncbi:alpha/beta fold hydrolase [Nocardioides sp. B-3]|uniref:alpha/beta fold hydrolase n=1 Tax=Nocardioides sp. B-3 TaxID=2895565 RepID=UPI0021525BE2|nr:alpha/beta fold hydrolase [Nocardioides sp. B-3]UUZ58252.1 alpha/beta fold hydrolase [Nocardioides sp. B-3]